MIYFNEIKILLLLITQPRSHLPSNFSYSEINWDRVLDYAQDNKVLSFILHPLACTRCQQIIPEKTLDEIIKKQLVYSYIYKLQKKEKNKLISIFWKQKIKAIPMKDYSYYGLRYPFSGFPEKLDIDFFLPFNSSPKIDRIMSQQKYVSIEYDFPKDNFASLEKDYVKKKHSFQILVNYHFKDALPATKGKINPLSQKKVDKFTKQYIRSLKKFSHYKFFLPSLEMNFVFLCLHFFFRDNFNGLRTLYEISQLVKQYGGEMDWQRMFRIVKKLEVESYFIFVVKISNIVFGAPLKPVVEDKIKKSFNINLALKLYSPFLSAVAEGPEEWTNPKHNRSIRLYRFLLRLILWQKPLIRKVGPRLIIYFWIYFLPTYFLLKRAEKSNLSLVS